MNKYLIFRTDRIGDFLISSILIKCIKRNDANSHITIISSDKNHSYIKKFPYVDKVIKLENSFFGKLSIIFELRKFKFKNIIIHDDKKRSKIISYFLKYNNKLLITNQNKFTHIEIIKKILKKLDFSFFEDSLNIFNHKKKGHRSEDFFQLHFDEKWIYNDYIKKFKNIEPSAEELFDFIQKIQKKLQMNLVITTGLNTPDILKAISPKLTDSKIRIIEDLDFTKLEEITFNSKLLVSCHGALSHVASAYNINQIDIIDRSYNYSRWTDHFRNYQFIYRDNFELLSKNILKKL